MGVNLEIFFCIRKRPIDDDFLYGLTNVLKKHGCYYNKWGHGMYIYTHDQDWISEDKVDGDPTGERLEKAIRTTSTLCEGAIHFGCLFNKEPTWGYISIYPYHSDPNWITVTFTTSSRYFYEHEIAIKNLIELSKSLYAFLRPAVGYIGLDLGTPPSLPETLKIPTIKDIAAINFLSPAIVEHFGKRKLLSASVWKVEELDDSGLILFLAPNPLNINEVKEKKEEVKKIFGLNIFGLT